MPICQKPLRSGDCHVAKAPMAYSPPKTKQNPEDTYQNVSEFPTKLDLSHGKAKPRANKTVATLASRNGVNGSLAVALAAQ
ncbi:hypothetical protein EC844_10932 [Acinetobacter calcoaceticus]|uniref:Uncharacterized protein n=1 Tax=Acinetobacter calcoaceticus TaxID=471 RepID=A0A4R1Y590_ACICA|nr:hypothetical protein EC844_10932 [Acinetobacter calcoaceticus]